jgi:glycosyltransferase involved in cell wall biosynthesis
MKENPELSIVVIALNEETNATILLQSILNHIIEIDYEIIFVDDGSTDGTVKEVKAINDSRIKLIELQRNFGQSAAMAAGIAHAEGDYIVTMDADLQNDPTDILPMLKLAREGEWDLVAGIRKNRKDGIMLRRLPSLIANSIIRRTTGIRIKDYGCTLRVFTREMARSLAIYGELHRFIPVLASFEGARITQTDVKHHPRIHGRSKYGLNRSLKVVSDLLLLLFFRKYLNRPMHLFGAFGLLLFVTGSALELYLFILKLLGNDIWGKPVMILGVVLLVLGIQFITTGIMAEMLMRTYYESQQKTPYKIRKITSFEG